MLNEYYEIVESIISIVADIKYNSCCDEIRDDHIKLILEDFFEKDLGDKDIGFNKEEFNKRPLYGYDFLRKLILIDKTLTSDQKLELVSQM